MGGLVLYGEKMQEDTSRIEGQLKNVTESQYSRNYLKYLKAILMNSPGNITF